MIIKKIRRRCKCGCGEITNYGKMYIRGHNQCGKKFSAETKEKMSEAAQGRKLSAETKLNMSLAQMKYDPNNPYCDIWKDREYRTDIRKNYCENIDCKKINKRLCNHHIHLDKKKCAPIDIMTMCVSCHATLHLLLLHRKNGKPTADPKDYIIINRPDHVSYIHKKSRTVIKINKIIK